MKNAIIILSVLILVTFFYIKSVIDSIHLGFNLNDLEFRNFDIESLNSNQSLLNITLQFVLQFSGLFPITISNLNLKILYKNLLVAESTNNLENKSKLILVNNINNYFNHTFDLKLNSNTSELLVKIKTKQKYQLNYQLSFKYLGITINYKGQYEN